MAKSKKSTKPRRQYGAVPYRVNGAGEIEVLLVTTRETRRWIVPKGWPMKNNGPMGAALQEAFEEAGVLGEGGAAIGEFHYRKALKSGSYRRCRVQLFSMSVTTELDAWPEMDQRERRWFELQDAAKIVLEKDLGLVLASLPDRLRDQHSKA